MNLNEGLVFREFIDLEPLTAHSKSGIPPTKEYRLFFYRHQLLYACPYWDEGDYAADTPSLEPSEEIAKRIQSQFFTMDIAKKRDAH